LQDGNAMPEAREGEERSPPLGEGARRVLEARCLRRDAAGRVAETPEQMWSRVADGVAEAERRFGASGVHARSRDEFHDVLRRLEFLPNSPALANAGTPLGQLAACFVLPIGDSTASIFDALRGMALVQRTGGGTGFGFSRLRPRNDVVRSTMGVASGPVSFMEVYNHSTEAIKQGGTRGIATRRV